MKGRLGTAWSEWKNGVKTNSSYMDFMGKVWDGIKTAYDIPESLKQDQYLYQLEIPQSLGTKLDYETRQ